MQKRKLNETILKQYEQQGNCCVYCKREIPFEDITRDHFEPKCKSNTFINNKVYSCYDCNQDKDSMNIHEFNALTFNHLCETLKTVVAQRWMITDPQLNRFKYLTARFVTTKNIIDNGGKPKFLFT